MRNMIAINSILFIYEQVVTDKYYNYNYHIRDDNNVVLKSNFIMRLISQYTIFELLQFTLSILFALS
jgi:hypothetical protein